ncbi:MAG: GNAT family N-acetyltransferase [Bacteroidales bacterium]
MKFEKIQQSQYKDFAEKVYIQSFPQDERRDFSLIYELIEKEKFRFFVIIDEQGNNKPIGIISLWDFSYFAYIEHFAVKKNLRNKGYGSKILDIIKEKTPKPIIIEVEHSNSLDAIRRINFYKRKGFTLLDEKYIQPSYSPDRNAISMQLMITTNDYLQELSIKEIISELHHNVYKII